MILLVTGGAGFIGSNFIHHVLATYPGDQVVNLDALTYAGNLENLAAIEKNTRYTFVKADIADKAQINAVFQAHKFDAVVHFAAESHVDRSIHLGPEAFIRTNILGTQFLINAALENKVARFLQVSTDEVYGTIDGEGRFTELTPIQPNNPYAATKAGSDFMVRAAFKAHGLNAVITRCSNNFGPYQFPEKLIPLMILNMLDGKNLPVYGDGRNIRDWLYVGDHNAAVWTVMNKGATGESYNIGGEEEWENIRLLQRLIELTAEESGRDPEVFRALITYVKDRPGHDRRYAIDCSRLKRELGWTRSVSFDEGLRATVRWYLANRGWCDRVRSGEYRTWLDRNYAAR